MSLSDKLTIDHVDFKGKRVFVRYVFICIVGCTHSSDALTCGLFGWMIGCSVDFNVPLNKTTGAVEDASRIEASVPTIQYLLKNGARSIVLASHLGRPDGRPSKKASLKPIVPVVSKLIGRPVTFVSDCVGKSVEAVCANPKPASDGGASVFLLENLRFHAEEEGSGVDEKGKKFKPTKEQISAFRASLSSLCDVYVNDAFGTVHRAHSSIVGVKPTSGLRAGGLLLKTELRAFSKALESPDRPYVAILGGAKVSDKIQLIENLLDRVNILIVGGGMAYTFLKTAYGMEIGNSLFDAEGSKVVASLIAKAKAKGVQLLLPIDHLITDKITNTGADIKLISSAAAADSKEQNGNGSIPAGYIGVDIGPQTAARNAKVIWSAKTVIFNGPMGVFEYPAFAAGTLSALQACAAATQASGATTIIGGGDTASAAYKFGFASLVSHVSTGGGASLELLEGKALPGIVSLSQVQAAPQSKL